MSVSLATHLEQFDVAVAKSTQSQTLLKNDILAQVQERLRAFVGQNGRLRDRGLVETVVSSATTTAATATASKEPITIGATGTASNNKRHRRPGRKPVAQSRPESDTGSPLPSIGLRVETSGVKRHREEDGTVGGLQTKRMAMVDSAVASRHGSGLSSMADTPYNPSLPHRQSPLPPTPGSNTALAPSEKGSTIERTGKPPRNPETESTHIGVMRVSSSTNSQEQSKSVQRSVPQKQSPQLPVSNAKPRKGVGRPRKKRVQGSVPSSIMTSTAEKSLEPQTSPRTLTETRKGLNPPQEPSTAEFLPQPPEIPPEPQPATGPRRQLRGVQHDEAFKEILAPRRRQNRRKKEIGTVQASETGSSANPTPMTSPFSNTSVPLPLDSNSGTSASLMPSTRPGPGFLSPNTSAAGGNSTIISLSFTPAHPPPQTPSNISAAGRHLKKRRGGAPIVSSTHRKERPSVPSPQAPAQTHNRTMEFRRTATNETVTVDLNNPTQALQGMSKDEKVALGKEMMQLWEGFNELMSQMLE